MPDYKRMYLTLVDETENVIQSLETALLRAEEIYTATAGEDDEEPISLTGGTML